LVHEEVAIEVRKLRHVVARQLEHATISRGEGIFQIEQEGLLGYRPKRLEIDWRSGERVLVPGENTESCAKLPHAIGHVIDAGVKYGTFAGKVLVERCVPDAHGIRYVPDGGSGIALGREERQRLVHDALASAHSPASCASAARTSPSLAKSTQPPS